MAKPDSSDLQYALALLDGAIGDPKRGLPEDVFLFVSRVTPLLNVDLLIKNERSQTLLTWRDDGLHVPGWHVPGGIVRYKETLADRIHAVAVSELGVDVTFDAVPLAVNELIHPSRSVRGHFLSFLYACRLAAPPDSTLRHTGGRPRPGAWAWHDRCPEDLISVHAPYQSFL